MDVLGRFTRQRTLALLTLGRNHGVADADLLAGTGLRTVDLSDSEINVTAEHEWTVIRNLQARVHPRVPLPLEAALGFFLAQVGPWGEAVRTAPTAGEALAFSVDYMSLFPAAGSRLSVEVDDATMTLWFDAEHVPADVRLFVLVRSVIIVAIAAQELLGQPVAPRAVVVAEPRPAFAARLDEFAGVTIEWRAERTAVVADAGWLALPLGDDPARHARAVQRCRNLLEEFEGRHSLSARVRNLLTLHSPALSAAEAARALATSERSLRRNLTAEGTTFRELVTQAREQLAARLLREGLSVEQTARRVGYTDSSAFSRAFKRWTGSAPELWSGRAPGTVTTAGTVTTVADPNTYSGQAGMPRWAGRTRE